MNGMKPMSAPMAAQHRQAAGAIAAVTVRNQLGSSLRRRAAMLLRMLETALLRSHPNTLSGRMARRGWRG
jgi:hypothetical protein